MAFWDAVAAWVWRVRLRGTRLPFAIVTAGPHGSVVRCRAATLGDTTPSWVRVRGEMHEMDCEFHRAYLLKHGRVQTVITRAPVVLAKEA